MLQQQGQKDYENQNLTSARGGFSSKLHAACYALGNPLHFDLTAGRASDAPRSLGLINGTELNNPRL